MATDGGPVIASSDRFAAVLPYCKILHEENHHRWGGIMPWIFPQQASKEDEEAFLLKEFSERECRLQGFRFLKQVWLSIALNNFENRIPLMVDGWFQHKGQEYLHDPDFQVYLLNEDACAQTFFEQADIALYGSTFLDTAVKCIQYRIRNPQQFAASSPRAPVTADESDAARIVSPVTTELPSLQPAKNTKVATSVTTTVLKPTATVFSSSSTPVQAAATVFEPSFTRRNFSDEADMPQQRYQLSRKRASTGKRGSFSDRMGHQPAQAVSDARQPFVKIQQGYLPHQSPGLPVAAGPVPPFATLGPNAFHLPSPSSHYPVPFSPGHPLPPGVFSSKPPPGLENPHMRNFPFHGPAGFVPGPPPGQTFGNPLLSERNMNHGSTGHFVRQTDRTMYDQGRDQSRKRRDSNASYGTRAGGSVRGRGRGRGRNSVSRSSIDEQYQPGHRHPSNGYNDRSGFAGNRNDHQLHVGQRAFEDRGSWRSQKHDENVAPIRHHFDPFPHGPPQILHNPRHASQSHGLPSGTQQAVNTMLPVINVDRRHVSGYQAPDNLSGDASDHCVMPLEKYGCSRTVIGEKCLYANKVIAFGIPADVPEHTIRQCFEQFGPVTHITEARSVLANGRPGEPHRFITFVAAPPTRACVKQRRVVIHGKQIDVEVAKEFWDPSHAKFEPRTATGIPFKDMQNSAPPSMHYIQNSAIGAMPQPTFNMARNNEYLPRDVYPVTAMDSMSVDTTPTASGSGTPKAKGKKSGKKNRKNLRDHSIDPTPKNTAPQVSRSLTPIADDASSVTTASTKHTTSAKRNTSFSADHAEPVPASPHAAPANEDNAAAPEVLVSSPSPSTEPRKATTPPPNLAQDQPQRGAEALSKPVEAEFKLEEDAVDDSFHTASATPSEVRSKIDDTIAPPKARPEKSAVSIDHVQVQTSPPQVVGSPAAISPKSVVNEEPVQKDDKKVLLPALPKSKSKVSIALPSIDTSRSPVSTAEDSSKANGTDGQRTVSGSSGIVTAFVTAPNTPGSPMFEQKGMPAVQSKKETKSSDDNKAKGPAQTESFSLFGKAKKTKKSKASKANSRTTSRAGPDLPMPDYPSMRLGTNTGKPAPLAEETELVKKTEETSNAEQNDIAAHESDTILNITAPEDTAPDANDEKSPSTESFDMVSNSSRDASDKPASPVRGSILRRLTGMFSGSSERPMVAEAGAVSGLGIQTEPANESSADKTVDNEQALSDNTEAIAAEASSSKKNKKKKKSKKKPATGDLPDEPIANAEQPKVMVLEMSHLAPSNEVRTPLYEFQGTDAEGTAGSHSGAATSNKDSGDSSPAKVKPSRRLISDSHLVQAAPIRRAHPRVKHKKSSDSSDSREESILSTGRDQPQSVSTRAEAAINNVCTIITLPIGHCLRGLEVVESTDEQDQLQKLYVVYTAIDPVEQAKRRLEQLAEQEKEMKQQRQEIGRIIEDDTEDDTEEAATVVDSVE